MKKDPLPLALVELANHLNHHRIRWMLGGSMMLRLRGYDVAVNDIDILVHRADKDKLIRLLNAYPYEKKVAVSPFQTAFLYQAKLRGVKADFMIDFAMETPQGTYVFPFDDTTEREAMNVADNVVYLSSLEEWERAYKAMNRQDKVDLIQTKKR